jgi:hypothetical protein
MGIYNSVQSGQKMNEYRSALSARMAQNAAKQAQAESPTLSPVGQSYLTAAEGALKKQTDSLKGIAATSGSGLNEAKAKSVYSSTLGGLISDLYGKDYALKQQRLNALEGYGNALYNQYLSGIAQQASQNEQAASQNYAGAVSAATSLLSPDTTGKGGLDVSTLNKTGDTGGNISFNPSNVVVKNPTAGIEPTYEEIIDFPSLKK